MRRHATDDVREDGPRSTSAENRERTVSITAEVVSARDGTAECTLFPADVSGVDLMTTWITAGESSFVALDDMR